MDRPAERHRRLTHRALPVLGGLAFVSLMAGLMVGGGAESAAVDAARRYAAAWERGDYAAMYALLGADSQSRVSESRFADAYRTTAATATATAVRVGSPGDESDGKVRLPVSVRTRIFGTVRGDVELPVSDDHVELAPNIVFPGLDPGGLLTRRSVPPKRSALVSRDHKVLARGPASARSSPLGAAASNIAGRVEPADDEGERRALYGRGFPASWPVGRTGLERAFESDLAGRPGGELLIGRRVIARARPRASGPVRTTIDSRVQAAAVTALAGRFGGIAALDARTGEVRALSGVAFSAPQPPGSTFKIVTTTAALEAHAVKTTTPFPVSTRALIDGVALENANGESCGGTFRESFAHSCNSVFAPLGVKVGAQRLAATAERYGFNEPASIPGEAPSTLPDASEIRSPLDVGSTAIGQGRVLATPLELASIAQAVAAHGIRTTPTLHPGARAARKRVTSRRVAGIVRDLMVDVVGYGTGTAAAIPGVKVAGKTGTAELEDTRGPKAKRQQQQQGVQGDAPPSNTDAWFAAFAPAERPRIAVGVMFVRAGAGGATAAPAARVVLATALGK
jgi:cell division protein FtsI/penicillin-binding protein 2